ncbi:MAG: hypothetical protein U1E05_06365, partial [Patescibacteria group bacterium]|nr:hypothetical protein [Patescibacteria group bacterium]
MEASQPATPNSDVRVIPFELALRAERENVREFLAAKRRQVDQAETQLLSCLRQLACELASGRNTAEAACREADQEAAQLAREAEHLEQLRAELEARQAEWQNIQEQTTHQQELFLATLRREREALDEQFATLDRRRAESDSLENRATEHVVVDDADSKRRYEMVLEDLRELKRENTRLLEQLEAAQRAPATAQPAAAAGGALS